MASTNKVFVSPGVYTSERDLTFVAQSVGVTTLGIVGETLQGPAFEPIFITNFDEYQVYFGGTSPEKFTNTQIPKYETSYIAKAYLQQSNQLFVTRVLGLSGYDAGPSWSITTIGNVDPGTVGLSANTSGLQIVNFTGTTGGSSNVVITGTLPSLISADFYNPYTTFNGGSSTLNANFQSFIANEIVYQSTASLNAQSGTTALFWGTVSDATFNSVTGATIGAGLSAYSETFGVSNVLLSQANLSATTNDPWYYALFDYSQVASVGSYNGYGFGTTLGAINSIGVGSYSGYCIVSGTTYSGTPYSGWDDLVIATLRSRGITNYSATQSGPLYQVTGITDVQMVCTGSYSAVTKDPYATFVVSGITKDADTFTFETSLLSTDTEYLSKVFGRSNFGKDRTEVPLFVEEVYSSLLLNGYRQGKVRGLNCDLIELNSAVSQASGSIGFYLEQYQTPETPYLVSELRGNKVYKLFKFKLISDGNAANRLVKISIGNISFNNGTFDVFVRDFYDNDQNVRVIESFTNCSLDPTLNNYVANKIGTANGEYNLNSKYIMLEMSDEAPEDALPCGFDGYIMRNYDQAQPPFIVYKTKYLQPGDVIYNPPFGSTSGADNPVISNGENPRKAYLGISNITGVDYDYFEYKGKQLPANLETDTTGPSWTYQIKGFHMDSGATVVTMFDTLTSATTQAFEVGAGSFNSEPVDTDNPYYRLNTRKFTLYPYGGFDGWDIYREYRTNSDTFALGQTGYKRGAAPSSQFPTATGWGAFKQISGPNQEVWANTDYYAYKWGQTTFANPEAVNINVFTTPGIDYVNNSNLVEDAIDMVETDRADSIYICTTPDFNLFLPTFSDVSEGLIYPQEAVDNLEETGIDSNYTATYYPWVLTRDSVNNTQIYLPATAEVTKNLALTDNIAFPWFASAGYTRGLVNSIKARKKLTQEDRDTLYKGRVNPIATFSDVGTVIWGNKTLQIRESALDRINVRRLLLQARKLISAVAVRLLFEQNDDKVRQDFLDSVNPILDSIRRDRGLIDFRVTVSNTPEDLDSNTLTGKIFLKPTRALEYIDIEFVITPTGASFDDV
jgi:phage tail sheath protein FI